MPGKLASLGLLRGPKGDTGPTGPAGADGVGGGGGAIHVDTLTALRSVSPEPTNGTVYYVGSDPEPFVYDRTSGIGFEDDGDTIIRISSGSTPIGLGSNGRFYRSSKSTVVATIAAARLAVAGKQKSIVVQSHSANGDGGGGHFDYDPDDITSTDNGGTVLVAGTRRLKRRVSGRINAKWFGAKGDARSIASGLTIASGTTLTFTGTNLVTADAGKTIWIALDDGTEHKTSIVSVNPGAHTAVIADAVPSAATSKHGLVATDDSAALQACADVVQATSQIFYTGVGFIQRAAKMFLPPGDYYCATALTTPVSIEAESASIFTGDIDIAVFDVPGFTGKTTVTGLTVHHSHGFGKSWDTTFNTSFVPDLIFDGCRHFMIKFWLSQNTAVNFNVKITNHHGEWGGALKGSGFIGTIDTYTGTSRLTDSWGMTHNSLVSGSGDWSGGGFIEIGGTEDGFTCGTTAEVASALNVKNISLSPGINSNTGAATDQAWFYVQGVALLVIDGRFGGESAGMPLVKDIADVDGCRVALGDGLVCPSGKYPVLDFLSAWEAIDVEDTADLNYGDTGKPVAIDDDAFSKVAKRNWMHGTLRNNFAGGAFVAGIGVVTVTGDLGSETLTNPSHIKVEILSTGARGAATFRVSIDGGSTYGSTQTTAATYAIPATSHVLHFSTGNYRDNDIYSSIGYLAGQYNYSADINHTVTKEPVGIQPSHQLALLSKLYLPSRPRVFGSSNLSGVTPDTFYTTASVTPNGHLDSDNVTINGLPGIKWFSTDNLAIDVNISFSFPESLDPGFYTACFFYQCEGITDANYIAYSTLGASPPRTALLDTHGSVRLATYTFYHDGGDVADTHIGSLLFSLGDGAANYFTVSTTCLMAGVGHDEMVPSELLPIQVSPYHFIGGETAPSTGDFQVGDVVWNRVSPGVAGKYDYFVCTASPHTFKGRGFNPLTFSKSSSSIGTLATGRILTDEHSCSGVSMGWRVHVAYSFDLDGGGTSGWLVLAEANANNKIKTKIVNLTGSAAPSLGSIDFILYAWPPEE